MQQWEYKTIVRSRGAHQPNKDKSFLEAQDWDIDMEKKLAELGALGWELVAVTPRSGMMGGTINKLPQTGPVALDYAGFTSSELWVFKRPKP